MRGRAAAWAAAADVVWVIVFAAIGRRSHDEHEGAVAVLATAWPFLAGVAVGWLVTRAWRRPLALWPTGVAVWAGAWAVGMLLRLATDQGIAPSFQVVAAVFLGLGLVGWRAVVRLASRRRATQARP
ncbi:DUF3054 domain-containing protein [Luteimicrobium xylanilyticum]|uniref:DUF3054 domain-containing protein n=1 Tax=Luteimicrobium xylanilyticum TaxID=1133546 RepID=A0A5P9Q8K3_9MICO|nr:DUF3054 domain-containing protein [Luteimicrobium xylanilyticum]QFU97754.1 hypothetical protein KDY119_01253 [Luteimicrobium xylanilyticum]